MATVNKDFRIKSGLVVEGANATVNGEDIITTGSTTDDLTQGTTNKYYSTSQAKTDAAELLTGATLTNITITGNGSGLTITAENGGIQDLTGFDTDDLSEGTTNKYFTNQRALDATASAYDAAGAAATAETNANAYTDTAIGNLPAAFITSTTSEFSVNNGELTLDYLNGLTQVNPTSGNQPDTGYGTIEYVDTDAGTEGLRIKSERGWVGNQFGGQLDLDAYRNVNIVSRNGDIVLNADGDTYLGSVNAGNDVATTGYVDTAAYNAQANAEGYVDAQLTNYTQTANLDSTVGGYGYLKSADLTGYATESYVGTAIDNLVDGAPGLLDTLNEIAAAINDDANYATTMTTALAGKQNSLTAGSNISIVSDTISVTGLSSTDISDFSTAALSATASAYDVAGAASSAETAANGYTDTAISGLSSVYEPIGAAATAVGALTTDDIEEGSTNLYFTDARAVDAITTETIYPPAVVINNLSKQVAATQTVGMIATVNGLTWAKSEYKSAKLTVKAKTASHTQLSEILVTLDGSDNVAITEYGIVYTDAELAVVSADVSGSDVRIRVTTVNPSTDVTVVGTLLV